MLFGASTDSLTRHIFMTSETRIDLSFARYQSTKIGECTRRIRRGQARNITRVRMSVLNLGESSDDDDDAHVDRKPTAI